MIMTYSAPSQGYNQRELLEANPVGIEYFVRLEKDKKDFTKHLPNKIIRKERLPRGLYGYTIIGDNFAVINETLDQTPELKKEVIAHECDHSPSEYDTRVTSKNRVEEESRAVILKRAPKNDYALYKGIVQDYIPN